MAVELAQHDLNALLGLESKAIQGGMPLNTSGIRVLQHFQDMTSFTLGSRQLSCNLQGIVGNAALNRPYLMHIVLAVSSLHLKKTTSETALPLKRQQLAVAGAEHWQTGLRMYQAALSQQCEAGTFSGQDFDSMVAASFLSIVFTFALDDEIAPGAFGSDDSPGAWDHILSHMAVIRGFRALDCIHGGAIPSDSAWLPIMQGTDDHKHTYTDKAQGIDGLPVAFVDLCGLTPDSTEASNPYHKIVRHLSPLLRAGLRNETTKLLAFVGRVWAQLQPLLSQGDSRSLLLTAWWLTLMRQVDQWWVAARAQTETIAIVNYLSTSSDALIQALLVFPASSGTADFSWIWNPQYSRPLPGASSTH